MKKNILLALLLSAFAANIASANVWINELHYSNKGTDSGEFFEIAGAAGTDLSDYFVQLINGNGTGSIYSTVNLTGFIDNESNGFGAVSFFEAPIQNGPNDGIKLFGPGNSLIQFLSYEGTLTFNGKTSTDIGVSESSSTTVGHSLQLIGAGSQYTDFTWAGPTTASAGTLNSGQTISAVPEPQTYAMFLAGLALLGFASRRRA